jgi:hypothetical protein
MLASSAILALYNLQVIKKDYYYEEAMNTVMDGDRFRFKGQHTRQVRQASGFQPRQLQHNR